MKLQVLDLFSGSGAMSLGLEAAGMKTVAFCENDPYCRRWLRHAWPGVPVFGDIHRLTRGRLELVLGEKAGAIDVICGGFPCQPFSAAGQRGGTSDSRYLWPEMLRIIKELKPTYVIGENVVGIVSMVERSVSFRVESRTLTRTADYDMLEMLLSRQETMLLGRICGELEEEGYEVQAFVIPACAAGAAHRRDRVYIVANAQRTERRQGEFLGHDRDRQDAGWPQAAGGAGTSDPDGGSGFVAHACGARSVSTQHEIPAGRNSIDHGGQDVAHACRPGLEERGCLTDHNGAEQPAAERGGGASVPAVADTACELRHGSRQLRGGIEQPSDGGKRPLEPGLGQSTHGPAALVAGLVRTVAPYGAEQYPWEEPRLVAHKTPHRRQKLQALGNAVYWPVVYEIGRAIMQAESEVASQ